MERDSKMSENGSLVRVMGPAMIYRKKLLAMIERLVAGALSVSQFRDEYYDFYIEQVPDDIMADRDYEFFGQIQEKLDWASIDPSDEDRLWGWISYEDYRAWTFSKLTDYLAGDSSRAEETS